MLAGQIEFLILDLRILIESANGNGNRGRLLNLKSQIKSQKFVYPPAGVAPAGFLYKRNPQAAAWRQCLHGGRHANASQSPVLPRARLAYDACLNAGSTAGACARPLLRTALTNWCP
jgi:hypothetical protein